MTEPIAKSFVEFTSRLRTERFDVTNAEHLAAFMDLHVKGRQHRELRFELEKPYLDVRSMMLSKLALQYVDGYTEATKKPVVKRVRNVQPSQKVGVHPDNAGSLTHLQGLSF